MARQVGVARSKMVHAGRPRMELLMGLEPMTSSLPRKCSTTELQQQLVPVLAPSGAGSGIRSVLDDVGLAVMGAL